MAQCWQKTQSFSELPGNSSLYLSIETFLIIWYKYSYKKSWEIIVYFGLEAATGGVLWKIMFLKILQNSQENTCVAWSFIKKETLANVFSCEFCEISKNTFFTEQLRATASVWSNTLKGYNLLTLYPYSSANSYSKWAFLLSCKC